MNLLIILGFLLTSLVCFASGMATGEFITGQRIHGKDERE